MTRVLIVGDTHSDASFVSNIHRVAKALEGTEEAISTIVQLGDFGFTFDSNMLASIRAWLDRDENHRWYWIDGNHDHHDYLDNLVSLTGWTSPISMSLLPFKDQHDRGGWIKFPDRLFYCPRGSTWTLGSTTCMALGGAYSIDKQYRTPGRSWWYQELITESDLRRVEHVMQEREDTIEVMFTHDTPITEPFETELNRNGYKVGHESRMNRQAMSAAVEMVKPKDLYHGHYHHRYDGEYDHDDGQVTMVHGIGANVSIPMRWAKQGQAVEDWNYVVREF